MDIVTAVRKYVTKMTDESGPGMKVLLMDKDTTSFLSMVHSHSEMLQREVYLFERIDINISREPMKHLKCIVFLRPTKENINLLSRELRCPRFGAYYIYISNIMVKADIKILAENDEQEVVRELEEMFIDYLTITPNFFSLNVATCSQGENWDPSQLQRCMQGVSAVLLSLKKRPVIRYRGGSSMAKRLAEKIEDLMTKEDRLFNFRNESPPLLLILDRQEDPITPLLTQWTYQAMVHELLTINNNRVDLRHVEDISKELEEIVLSALQDEFYSQNMLNNYGEIGQTIKSLMSEYQRKVKANKKLDCIADMKSFVESYPQFKKMSGTVSKHIAVVGELSKIVAERKLLEISELEQQIVSLDQHALQLQSIKRILSQSNIRQEDASRLVMLYALKYGSHPNNHINGLIGMLSKNNVSQHWINLINKVIKYGRRESRLQDFDPQDAVIEITKRFMKDLQEVENIYTQHTPVLKKTLDDLIRGKLKDPAYPYLQGHPIIRPVEIVVFIVGGATYEEYLAVHQLRSVHPNYKIILGGSTVHNSTSFLKEVESAVTITNVHQTYSTSVKNY